MKIDIVKISGEKTGRQVELNDAIFGIEPNDHAIYLSVKQYLANQRQGTHKAKERSEVAGSTRKLHRQKGTGGSRKGDIKNPIFRTGGTIFGPRPRNYSFKLNRKVKELARRSALAYKAQQNGIVVVEDFNFDAPKTKMFAGIMKSLGISDKKSLVVAGENENVMLSMRNLPKVSSTRAEDLSTYSVMNAQCLVLTESAVKQINQSAE
ncbi:MAG TPA: 50S ribosomal protein L4 [Chitinophagales bacterium]|nr:50S ribosomal protein L4 [Chitinophagales bacterium]HNA58310.1 50S ribosomal protein L4 [Chitinophagales bacterium]HNE45531.1 50S ribosomal protein L4 [Chitinophagales bacterium]HNF67729.1 50S ribosomal protein L4 [Chitinophagales bacterium]HNI53684.1 50S ribosomal protein L4 [Chitinophagales bacterium]